MFKLEFKALGHCPVNGALISANEVREAFAPLVEVATRNEQQLEMLLEHCLRINVVSEGECVADAIIQELARVNAENERLKRLAMSELQQHEETINDGNVECGLLQKQCEQLQEQINQVTRERDQWKEVASA